MAIDTLPALPASFPNTPLDIRAELQLAGTWTDITSYLRQAPQVVMSRGHPDESTTTAPSSLALTINNKDGRFSSLNPLGPYYGNLGRNTPIRISFPEGASYLRSETDQASFASTPNAAGFVSENLDADIQIDLTLDNWNGITQTIASHWNASGQRGFFLAVTENGYLQLVASTDGTAITFIYSTIPVPLPPLLRQCVRVTFAHATGNVAFYTAPAGNLASASWTQLGGTVASGITTIYNSNASLEVGWCDGDTDFNNPGIYGKIHAFQLFEGGTLQASPDFTAQAARATSFTDAQSNTWTVQGTAEISNRKYRFHGEVASWPQAWDLSGRDVNVQLQAGGLLRRLSRIQNPLNSALYRANVRLTGATAPVAYWPGEDVAGATQIASALSGPAMTISGPVQLASNSSFACSAPIPVLNGAVLTGKIPAYTSGNDILLRFLLSVPTGGDTNNGLIATVATTGSVRKLNLIYGTGGILTMQGFDGGGTMLFTSGMAPGGAPGVAGVPVNCQVYLQKSGTSIAYGLQVLVPGASAAIVTSGTLASSTVGVATSVTINSGAKLTTIAVGHISVQSTWDSLFDTAQPLNAWLGEAAGRRFERLCSEEGVAFRGRGNLDDTVTLGYQTLETLVSLLQECADADRGQWTEPRQVLGWGYRTRVSLGNQSAAVTLDYAQAEIGGLTPVEDDQSTQNDITVTNTDWSSSRQYLATGPMSILAPPSGIGRYDTSVSVNLAADTMLDSEASWLLHTGTVNESRYPSVAVNLALPALASLFYALQDIDIGDRLVIVNPPAWLPPGQIDQLVQQSAETAMFRTFTETWACVPSSPYNTGYADDLVYGRADTDGSALHANITSGATSMSVDTTGASGILWTTAGGDFPFDVLMGGERITVTNITGSSSPQSFTVTRSVNGVVKAHTTGESVALFYPPIVSL